MQRKVLIIDDRTEICRIIERVAGQQQFDAQMVEDSRQAVGRFVKFCPDLVILDMVMPEMDGPQVLQGILQSGIRSRILLTTGAGTGDRLLRIAEGIARFHGQCLLPVLFKPFRLAQLVGVFQQVSAPVEPTV